MNFTIRFVSPMLIAASLCGACYRDPRGDDAGPDWTAIATEEQGLQVNGLQVNGLQVNGLQVNGLQVNGLQVNGLQVNGLQVNGLQVNGTLLTGVTSDGSILTGGNFIGAEVTAILANGQTTQLRIDDVTTEPDPDLNLFAISYFNGTAWESACGYDANGNPIGAYPMEGRWDYSEGTATGGSHINDPTMFTFACKNAALAKCVDMGYRPWKSVEECDHTGACQSISMRHLHQACTRMLRADYCGDGAPHTIPGTLINAWDTFGLQTPDTTQTPWLLEAEWSERGATCVKHARWTSAGWTQQLASWLYIAGHCPDIIESHTRDRCGTPQSTFTTGAGSATPPDQRSLLRNESCFPSFTNTCGP